MRSKPSRFLLNLKQVIKMKKLMFAMLAFATLAFAGCSKDDEDQAPSLTGTEWTEQDGSALIELSFTSSDDCRLVFSIPGTILRTTNYYTYEYNHPTVRMYPETYGNAELRGTISGSTMSVVNTSTSKTIYSLTKEAN